MAKPFDDPQRAIKAAVSGDVIHITQGSYHGKLGVGYLVIEKRGLTLAGGYKDASFKERNPFKYPTMVVENPDSKSSTFGGGYIRVDMGNRVNDHESTTIDGFWFDRKGQNSYVPPTEPPAKCPGCLSCPTGSNTKPVIDFEHPDCHIRNSVFMNTALYAIRLNGDGSSLENNLFLNTNYAGIEIFGKGRKIAKGYPFHRFLLKNNTFVSVWNCCSLERGAGSFLVHAGGADVTLEDNIFHLSSGNTQSLGYGIKDERNFKADKWIHLRNNSFSQLRGGIATVYMTDLNASANIDWMKQLGDTPWEVKGNDDENPFFEFDKDWLESYTKATPRQDPNDIKVNMDHFNQMRRMLGLPLDAGSVDRGGGFLAWHYPIEHVKKGGFFTPSNPKLKGRGIQAGGGFAIQRASLLEAAGAGDETAAAAPSDREYQEVTFEKLWDEGDSLVDQAVKFKAYYSGKDSSYGAGFGKKAVAYLEGADKNTHTIYKLRAVPEWEQSYFLKGYVAAGSAAGSYVDTKAKRTCGAKGDCEHSFTVHGVVKKAGSKLSGKVPQIVIAVDAITGD